MSERMWLAEQLEEARTQRDVLRVRVKELEEVDEEPFPGSPDDMMNTIAELRARVAKLEAALADAGVAMADWHDGGYKLPHLIQRIDAVNAVLEDAP